MSEENSQIILLLKGVNIRYLRIKNMANQTVDGNWTVI